MARRGHGEGSIYLRGDGRWAASISLEGGKRKTFYGKTRREVQEQLKTALHQQQQGMLVTEPQQKVSSFLPQWLEDVHKHKVRPRTYERYEAAIRLHLALDKAVRWNLVPRNVCDAVDPPRRKRYEFQPLNQEQIRQFLAAATGHRLEALFVLALATGMRKGELMALKWQDINFATATLQVRRVLTHMPARLNGKGGYVEAEPKTEASRRSITIAQLAIEKLKQHRVRQLEAKLKAGPLWKENDLVFCSSVGGHLHTSRDVFTQFKKVLKQAGLPDIRFHDLRHSAATMLLGLDIHPKVVQEMLGHSQIAITLDIYSHVLPTMQQVAVSRLNDVLQG